MKLKQNNFVTVPLLYVWVLSKRMVLFAYWTETLSSILSVFNIIDFFYVYHDYSFDNKLRNVIADFNFKDTLTIIYEYCFYSASIVLVNNVCHNINAFDW